MPRPQLRPVALFPRRPVERVIVFARLPNPTFDYYCAARIDTPAGPPGRVADIRGEMPTESDAKGALVIICRYVSARALSWIERNEAALAGVALFTDDDVSTFVLSRDAKPGYRFFLFQQALWPLRRLNRQLDRLYVSTAALADTFADCGPVLLPPAPPETLCEPAPSDRDGALRLVFHAKAIHDTEHAFLAPIMREVLALRRGLSLEVSGDERSLGHWAGIPGVSFAPEIPWPAYVEATRREGADIVLVPLLPSPSNVNRSDTKRIDVARMGGAGVFSISPAYGEADGSDETLLPNEAGLWRDAILRLIDDPAHRATVAEATRRKVAMMAARAAEGFPI